MPLAMEWGQFEKGVFLVNVLGIIHDPKSGKVLIGRREGDPHLPRLSWCLPGGRPTYEHELEESLVREIEKKTGLRCEVKKILFVRTYPERREFLSIYYLCEWVAGELKDAEKHVENKWVLPSEVRAHFAHPAPDARLLEALEELERTSLH